MGRLLDVGREDIERSEVEIPYGNLKFRREKESELMFDGAWIERIAGVNSDASAINPYAAPEACSCGRNIRSGHHVTVAEWTPAKGLFPR